MGERRRPGTAGVGHGAEATRPAGRGAVDARRVGRPVAPRGGGTRAPCPSLRDLVDPTPDPGWERRHPDQPERWSFDFCVPDGSLGGFVGLGFRPAERVAWYWAALAGTGRPHLLVRDLDLALPGRPGSRQLRGEGLWADANCETPHDHWSLGLEAFGVAMDDPADALVGELGDRIGLGLDLEWEAAGPVEGEAGDYAQPCSVSGEVLVGVGSLVETIAVDGHGWRRHEWGDGDWLAPAGWSAGRLDDGRPWRSPPPPAVAEVVARAPLLLELGGRRAVLDRRLVRVSLSDGRAGAGWTEDIGTDRAP